MAKGIGSFAYDTTEKVIDFSVDYPALYGFGSVLVYPDTDVQISKNDNANYITYSAMDKILIPGFPHPVTKLYVKAASGTGNLRYWAYK